MAIVEIYTKEIHGVTDYAVYTPNRCYTVSEKDGLKNMSKSDFEYFKGNYKKVLQERLHETKSKVLEIIGNFYQKSLNF